MSYAAAIDGLQALAGELATKPGAPRRKFRLEDMRTLLAELGDPQRRFPSVLVAGTNGKGSTAATLAGILAAAGYKVGLYTSPHLARVNERIRILDRRAQGEGRDIDPQEVVILTLSEERGKNLRSLPSSAKDGQGEISDEAFAALYFQVDEAASRLVADGRLPDHSSFFEAITALAFLHFAAEAVDLAVLEVGMGGRLDATNVVEPLVSVITDISLDHTEWLGPTIDAIAREKAGILRPNGVMVTLPQHREANEALGEIAVALGVRGVNAAEYIPAPGPSLAAGRNRYAAWAMGEPIEIDSPLAGQHQQRNIALAIAAATELRNNHGYNISAAHVAAGVRDTQWPGRLEILPGDGRRAEVLLDVAHNPAGAWALRSAVSAMLDLQIDDAQPARPTTLLFGCLRDKALAEMAQILFPLFDHVVLTQVDSPRTASIEDMLAAAAATGCDADAAEDPAAALALALQATPANGLVVAAGSVYLVGKLRALLTGGAS
jgi:dihydrofolate synthase/folylpolyglutamate synthase